MTIQDWPAGWEPFGYITEPGPPFQPEAARVIPAAELKVGMIVPGKGQVVRVDPPDLYGDVHYWTHQTILPQGTIRAGGYVLIRDTEPAA